MTSENLVNPQQIRETVEKDYTRVVERSSGCCGSAPTHPEETDQLQAFLENVTSVHVEAMK